MAATPADIGWGTTLTFQSGLMGRITSAAWANFGAREARDTSYMGTTNGWRTFLPTDLRDPGELTVEALWDKSVAALKVGVAAAIETVTLTAPIHPVIAGGGAAGAAGAIIACSGFSTGFSFDVPMDDVMTSSLAIKLSGEPTVTDGS